MAKRKAPDSGPDSGSGSRSIRSKKKGKLEKNLKSRRHKNLKESSKAPKNRCSSPISDSTDGLTSGSKSHSSAHDIQTTKRKKNKALSRDHEDGSFVSRTTEVSLPLENKTSADHSFLIGTVEKRVSAGSSSEKADDIARKSGIAHDRSKHQEKYKSTNKKRSSDTYSANSPRISEMFPAQKDNDEACSLSNQPPSVQKHIDVVINSTAADSETKKFLQIDSALKDEKRRRRRKRKRSKRKSENSQCGENIKENEDPNAKGSNMTSAKVKRKVKNIKCGVNVDTASNSAKTCLDKSSNSQQCSPTGKRIISSHLTKNQDEIDNSAVCSKKKLIVLDLNGVLVDIQRGGSRIDYKEHTRLNKNLVLKRPYCDGFLSFCFERFHVGVWTSRRRHNADLVINYLMGNLKHKLLFCWDESKCTETGEKTLKERGKPLVLKELKKLWNKEHYLPWEKGAFSQSNTLLIDDSPYKSICNPPHTAIFPQPYNCMDKDDNSLGPGGELRVYLERLAMADDVQVYVREHPFGQKAISSDHPSWNFYRKIINRFQNSSSRTT